MKISIPKYTIQEEKINSITHLIGGFLSLIGIFILIRQTKTSKELLCSMIFSTSLTFLYFISGIYHGLPKKSKWKKFFRLIDHCNVYILELATFLPICFITLEHSIGTIYFLILLFFTIIGIILNCIVLDKVQLTSVIIHLLVGWSVLLITPLLYEKIKLNGLVLLFLGGIIYTIGAILYRLGIKQKYMHCIFHIFCLMGSLCHYLLIYIYIL